MVSSDKIMDIVLKYANRKKYTLDKETRKRHTDHLIAVWENSSIEKKKYCPKCSKVMIKRPDKFHEGKFWWGCSGWPKCNYSEKE